MGGNRAATVKWSACQSSLLRDIDLDFDRQGVDAQQ
jgi:hypothetical protein